MYYLVFCINQDNERQKKEYFDKNYKEVLVEILKDKTIKDISSLERIY